MRYHVLAADYDGTLAKDGRVDPSTIDMLKRLRDSGRKLILVTGRRLEPILELMPSIGLFDRIVAENGALVFNPQTSEETLLADSPPQEFIESLRYKGVDRLEWGRCIVAMWKPHEHIALEVIREMSLELQIIFNKDAVMVLPSGVNKAFGLTRALKELGLSAWNTAAVGDAENDEAMLRQCGASVAVANALEPVKKLADVVTQSARGQGVEELIADILETDLKYLDYQVGPNASHTSKSLSKMGPNPLRRSNETSKMDSPPEGRNPFQIGSQRGIVIGTRLDGTPFTIPEFGQSILVTGGPGGGKSRLAIGILERLSPRGVQCCIIDPEGDYQGVEEAVTLGNAERAPSADEVIGALERSTGHCTLSLFSVEPPDRPAYFDKVYRGLSELRSRTGRPHWIIVDEAHYTAPREWQLAKQWSEAELDGMIFITAFHEKFSETILPHLDWIISIAEQPEIAIAACCKRMGEPIPTFEPPEDNQTHHALAWCRSTGEISWFSRIAPRTSAQRHGHSLYEGEMDEHLQFVFRGPESKLNLVTPNLKQFISIASGVDDETWDFHKLAGDYSRWIEDVIKDPELAEEVARIEHTPELNVSQSREGILELIRERFEPKW